MLPFDATTALLKHRSRELCATTQLVALFRLVRLKKITVPVLVMHGDDDQIVPYADSAPLSAKLLRNSTLKTYKGFPHGMPTTEADTINADLLTFLKGASTTAAA